MDALVKLVLERLEKRMTSTATFMVTECNSYDEHILLQNQLISFAGIDYGHIREFNERYIGALGSLCAPCIGL